MRKLTEQDIANITGSTLHGYHVEAARIKQGPFIDSDHYGFILGKNSNGQYVTWEFHLTEDESVSVYWGHYIMDREEALRLHNQIWNTGVRAAMENGGVINDHHGIGLKLARLMKEQYGPAFQVMEGLKKALDPNGIMNPYKLGL